MSALAAFLLHRCACIGVNSQASDPPVMQQVQVQARQTWGVFSTALLSGPGAVGKGHHAWLGKQGDLALPPVGILQGGMGKGLGARLLLPLSAVTGSPFLSPLQPNGIQSLCNCSMYIPCTELIEEAGQNEAYPV